MFYYGFAALFSVTLFASCSDDDEIGNNPSSDTDSDVIDIDEDIAGNYGGTLTILVDGTVVSGDDGIKQNVTVAAAGDASISLSITDFSFLGIEVGDIELADCPLASTDDGGYSFTADPIDVTSTDSTLTCSVTLESGTIVNDTLSFDLSISATLGTISQEVEVTFTGVRGVTVESESSESSEAAITSFSFDTDYETHPMHQVIVAGSVSIDSDNHTVTFSVDEDMLEEDEFAGALAYLYPEFTISENATCDATSGEVMDFTGNGNSVTITVTAENGTEVEWVITANLVIVPTTLSNDFNSWTETTESGSILIAKVEGTWETVEPTDVWASANLGCFALTNSLVGVSIETLAMSKDEGKDGYAALLQTLDTGNGTGLFNSYAPAITPGTLYTGSFSLNFSNTLASTYFGISYKGKPSTLNVTYKYEAGTEYVNGTTGDEVDKGMIVAVLYEATDDSGNDFHLDGTNIKDETYHVMSAWAGGEEGVSDTGGEWTTVSVPFEEIGTYDSSKSYKLAVVFQSSINGADEQGAIGSKLWIDNMEVLAE